MLLFEKRGKPEYPGKNLLEQGREPTTNATPHMPLKAGLELLGHISADRSANLALLSKYELFIIPYFTPELLFSRDRFDHTRFNSQYQR